MLSETAVCQFCNQWLQPDNHRVRVRPKPKPTPRQQTALTRQSQGKHLSKAQNVLLQRYYKSSSVLTVTCFTCNKTSRYKGMSRESIPCSQSHSTPESTGKHKTPQSVSWSRSNTPKSRGKDMAPIYRPRASISTNTPSSASSTSSKSPGAKGKNCAVQCLSKILMRDDGESKKKGGIKDFLSSL